MDIEIINKTFKRLQAQQLLLEQQKNEIASLQRLLMVRGNVIERTSDEYNSDNNDDDGTNGEYTLHQFLMTAKSAETHIYNLGSPEIIAIASKMKDDNAIDHQSMVKRIAVLFLGLVYGLSKLSPERSDTNGPLLRAPPICLPKALLDAGSRKFHSLLSEQRARLLANGTEAGYEAIGRNYAEFRHKYDSDAEFRAAVDSKANAKSFSEAWSQFHNDFPSLVVFANGLASVFPGTSTVESDFSVIGIEKDAHRKRLANLSLEGVLHTKQRMELYCLKEMCARVRGGD